MELDRRVRDDLRASTRFRDFRLLASTSSTNSVAAAGQGDGLVVVADHQTAGRGRLDRSWEAQPGDGLLVSVRFEADLPSDRPQLVTAAAALAARQAVAAEAGVEAEIKWPNDLLAGGAKLAGILAEAGPGWVVVGMGINVHGGPPGAAVLDDLGGRRTGRSPLLVRWLRELDHRLGRWDDVASEYGERCATVGREVRVQLGRGGELVGVAVGIDGEGRLLVRPGGGSVEPVAVGDVTHLR